MILEKISTRLRKQRVKMRARDAEKKLKVWRRATNPDSLMDYVHLVVILFVNSFWTPLWQGPVVHGRRRYLEGSLERIEAEAYRRRQLAAKLGVVLLVLSVVLAVPVSAASETWPLLSYGEDSDDYVGLGNLTTVPQSALDNGSVEIYETRHNGVATVWLQVQSSFSGYGNDYVLELEMNSSPGQYFLLRNETTLTPFDSNEGQLEKEVKKYRELWGANVSRVENLTTKVEAQQDRLSLRAAKIQDLEKDVTVLEERRDDLVEEVNRTDSNATIQVLREQVDELESDLAAAQSGPDVSWLEKQLAKKQERIQELESQVQSLNASTYSAASESGSEPAPTGPDRLGWSALAAAGLVVSGGALWTYRGRAKSWFTEAPHGYKEIVEPLRAEYCPKCGFEVDADDVKVNELQPELSEWYCGECDGPREEDGSHRAALEAVEAAAQGTPFGAKHPLLEIVMKASEEGREPTEDEWKAAMEHDPEATRHFRRELGLPEELS